MVTTTDLKTKAKKQKSKKSKKKKRETTNNPALKPIKKSWLILQNSQK